ncbi:MAG TPA: MazG family protein [Mycobacteriales bacterium]|nr:MazG family protein [Mycobacteriales bacterium]
MSGPEGVLESEPRPPGAALVDAVAVMDRLRSPGGCPWDAEQTHASLAPYLLEEAYEAFQAIEDGDLVALRDELGDVLLQVLFHARLAEELPDGESWSVDDVASGLVAKLERRHPHVFGDVDVAGADEVNRNWEQIKARERGGKSPVASVPMTAPALTLAAKLQRKAAAEPTGDTTAFLEAAQRFAREDSADAAGELLWAAVAVMRARGIDAEAALRARARVFRDKALNQG